MHTILVIDDEKPVLEMLKLALTRMGYRVSVAASGLEGIHMFGHCKFDLVITDILMPGLDGNDVVDHIRRSDRPFTPVIGMSGTPWLLDADTVDMVLPKPFSIYTLFEYVQQLIAPCRNKAAVG